MLIINNKNYEAEVYIGSQNFYDFETNGQVDGIIALRSTGSLLKPFLYAKIIDDGKAAPQSKIPDVPLYFSNFTPQNADKKYRGMVEMQDALIKSLNIPFVHLFKRVWRREIFLLFKRDTGF